MRDAVRVALLARPGAGADRLREALAAAGAELVLEADPTTLEPATLVDARAESIVVVLDAAVEEALDRLDPVLHDPAIDVLYEESEVAAAREGWDAARWNRHLSAKLLRHDDVLPPGREADGEGRAPAARPAGPAGPVPVGLPAATASPAKPPPAANPPPPPVPSMFDPVAAEYDPADAAATAATEVPEPAGEPPDAAPTPDWDHLALEIDVEAPAAAPPAPAPPPPAPMPRPTPAPTPASARAPAPTAADASPGPRGAAIRDFRRDLADIEQRIASMGLVADDRPAAETLASDAPAVDAPAEDSPAEALAAAEDHTPSTGLPTPVATSGRAAGAVLVFAGIGGPDAVRQFLGALPDTFPRPVLIHQRLDGGRHDRLVQQMARATSLPVHLAAEDDAASPGHVYILPPGLGLSGTDGLRFAAGTDPMATLPSAGSAVLMFSGSDTALVDAAMDHASAGAMVAGQSPEDCYDAAAADALVARGAESGQPADLARRLAERWAA